MAIGAFNTLWLFTKFLQPEEVGLVKVLLDTAAIIAPFTLFGIGSIINRYYPFYSENDEDRRQFYTFTHLIPLVSFIVFVIIFLYEKDLFRRKFSANSEMFLDYLWLVIPITAIIILRTIYTSLSRSLYRIVVPKLINDVLVRLGLATIIITYGILQFQQQWLIYGYFLMYAMALVFLVPYVNFLSPIRFSFKLNRIEPKMRKDMAVYGVFVILGGIGTAIVTRIDTVMITSLLGLENTGIYAISLYIGAVIEVPRKAIAQISIPLIAQAWKDENISVIKDLYKKSSINQLIVGGVIFSLIWCNIDSLFEFIPNGDIYASGKYVVLFIGLAKLFDMLMGVNAEIIQMSKYYKYNILIMIVLIISALILNYWLIPIYGITGAALATAASILIYNLLRFLFLIIKVGIHPFSINTIIASVIIGITFILGMVIPDLLNSPLINIAIKSTIMAVLSAVLIYKSKISEDINNSVHAVFNRFSK